MKRLFTRKNPKTMTFQHLLNSFLPRTLGIFTLTKNKKKLKFRVFITQINIFKKTNFKKTKEVFKKTKFVLFCSFSICTIRVAANPCQPHERSISYFIKDSRRIYISLTYSESHVGNTKISNRFHIEFSSPSHHPVRVLARYLF